MLSGSTVVHKLYDKGWKFETRLSEQDNQGYTVIKKFTLTEIWGWNIISCGNSVKSNISMSKNWSQLVVL